MSVVDRNGSKIEELAQEIDGGWGEGYCQRQQQPKLWHKRNLIRLFNSWREVNF